MGDQFTIVIDKATLDRLKGEYGSLLEDIDKRFVSYQWDTADSKSELDLGEGFPLKLGDAGFTAAVDLVAALERVRANIGERMKTVYDNSYNLYWGLQFLLEDSQAVEDLNTMSAQQFSGFMPSDSAPSPGDNGGSGVGTGGMSGGMSGGSGKPGSGG